MNAMGLNPLLSPSLTQISTLSNLKPVYWFLWLLGRRWLLPLKETTQHVREGPFRTDHSSEHQTSLKQERLFKTGWMLVFHPVFKPLERQHVSFPWSQGSECRWFVSHGHTGPFEQSRGCVIWGIETALLQERMVPSGTQHARAGLECAAGSTAGRAREHCVHTGCWKALSHGSGAVPTRVHFMALATELFKDWLAASQMKRSLASPFQNLAPVLSVILDDTHSLFR